MNMNLCYMKDYFLAQGTVKRWKQIHVNVTLLETMLHFCSFITYNQFLCSFSSDSNISKIQSILYCHPNSQPYHLSVGLL